MTRRKFIRRLTAAAIVLAVGTWGLTRKVTLHTCVWAARLTRYPGHIEPAHDILEQGKWSG